MSHSEKTKQINEIFDGKIIKLELHQVELSNGKTVDREIIRHRGGVAVIPINENKEIYLVKQYRRPYDKELLEVPAGKLEAEEKPEVCGERELQEETGLRAEKLTYLTQMYPSPGYTDEVIHIYKAEGLTEGKLSLDEDEFLNVEKYTLGEALSMVQKGIITDAKSVIAILLLHTEINS